MNDKQRLEEIKRTTEKMHREEINYNSNDENAMEWYKDMFFLIEMSEEKIKLQERVDGIMQEYIALKNLHNISVKANDMTTKENQRYKQALETAAEELHYALNSNKSDDVKRYYVENAKRFIDEALKEESE